MSRLRKLIKRRERSFTSSSFTILAKNDHAVTYQDYLKEKGIKHKTAIVSEYEIFWDFSGNDIEINNLRTLISY